MPWRGKKLGLLISVRPEHPNFARGLKLAETALEEGVDVYLYCIDEAVHGVGHPHLLGLQERGLKLFACAYGAHRRNLAVTKQATFSGLATLNDIIMGTDRFVSFN